MIALNFFVIGIASAQSSFSDSGSGACSDHGGVDCSRQNLYTMNVVCKDGWEGSSVSYTDVCTPTIQDLTLYLAMASCRDLLTNNDPDRNPAAVCVQESREKLLKQFRPNCTEAVETNLGDGSAFCESFSDFCANDKFRIQTSYCLATKTDTSPSSAMLPTSVAPMSVSSSNTAISPIKTVKFFIGTPKSRTDLANCYIVGNISTRLYYRRGSSYIKSASYKGKICFTDEESAKKAKYHKSALSK